MSIEKLKYLAVDELDKLYKDILVNLGRYRNGEFRDLSTSQGWNIQLSVKGDLSHLEELKPESGQEAEVTNSLLVWKALHRLTPALACEDRLWTRLSHVEGCEYAKKRWFRNTGDDLKDVKQIRTHFFAGSQTQYRDDHALSRLWWNAFIAQRLRPDDQEGALNLLLQTADVRSNLVERSRIVSRPILGRAILRAMETDSWLTDRATNFRHFMIAISRYGGGRVLESEAEEAVDLFVRECASTAKEWSQEDEDR